MDNNAVSEMSLWDRFGGNTSEVLLFLNENICIWDTFNHETLHFIKIGMLTSR